MQFVTGLFVVTEIDELTSAQIQRVWPIAVLTTGVEHDELLVRLAPSFAKSPVSDPRENFRNRIVGSVSGGTLARSRLQRFVTSF
jgi:hypothetical protein